MPNSKFFVGSYAGDMPRRRADDCGCDWAAPVSAAYSEVPPTPVANPYAYATTNTTYQPDYPTYPRYVNRTACGCSQEPTYPMYPTQPSCGCHPEPEPECPVCPPCVCPPVTTPEPECPVCPPCACYPEPEPECPVCPPCVCPPEPEPECPVCPPCACYPEPEPECPVCPPCECPPEPEPEPVCPPCECHPEPDPCYTAAQRARAQYAQRLRQQMEQAAQNNPYSTYRPRRRNRLQPEAIACSQSNENQVMEYADIRPMQKGTCATCRHGNVRQLPIEEVGYQTIDPVYAMEEMTPDCQMRCRKHKCFLYEKLKQYCCEGKTVCEFLMDYPPE